VIAEPDTLTAVEALVAKVAVPDVLENTAVEAFVACATVPEVKSDTWLRVMSPEIVSAVPDVVL
jgi:hypothetical protein